MNLANQLFPGLASCPSKLPDVPSIADILCVLGNTISVLVGIAGGVALLFLLYGGIQYMISGGDEKALGTAKSTITYSLLGLVIVILAVFVINQVLGLLTK